MNQLGAKSAGWICCIVMAMIGIGPAAAQEACTTYTVQDGDTLGSIADAAYGTFDYQRIFNANREALTTSSGALTAGMELILPCEDGRLTPDAPVAEIATAEEPSQAPATGTGGTYSRPVRLLSANGWAAFADEGLTGGGMFVRLATTALQRAGNTYSYKSSFVDDVVSHIDTLLPSGAFDVGIAWDIEDCSNVDLLPELSRKLCTEYNFSDPIYEIVYSYATLTDSPYAEARAYADFAGAKMCRPAAWASSDLIRNGLVEPTVTWVRPEGFTDCYEMLLKGEVDVYAMDIEFIADNARNLGGGDEITVSSSLTEFMPQGFIVLKTNPRGEEILTAINAGLREMRETGEWYDIVASSLSEYNALGQ
ncbi:MAG: transporter substrate-binding domain-containing protein [Tabrizicola sp.]|nr:transporter substrate-binding domain-containing protein [Tabrizicola sp.]